MAKHTRETVGSVEIEAVGEPTFLKLAEEVSTVWVEKMPGTVPRGPSPRAYPTDEKCRRESGIAGELAGIDMAYAFVVVVDGEGVVHEFEKMRSNDEVIFQNNNTTVLFDAGSDTVDDVGGKAPVMVALNDGDALKTADGTNVITYGINSRTVGLRTGSIGIDVKRALGSKGVGTQGFDAMPRMFGAVIDEQQDRGGSQCFHPRFMFRVDIRSESRCQKP